MEDRIYWFLACNTKLYDIHTLFKENGYCLWIANNQSHFYFIGKSFSFSISSLMALS